MKIRKTKCPSCYLMGVKPERVDSAEESRSPWHFQSWNRGPEPTSGPRWSKWNSAECRVSGSGFRPVGVYITFRAGKQFLAGVVISGPLDNQSTLGINTVCQG